MIVIGCVVMQSILVSIVINPSLSCYELYRLQKKIPQNCYKLIMLEKIDLLILYVNYLQSLAIDYV